MAGGVTDTAKDLGGKLIGSLPAQFLALICVNVVFIGGLLWFVRSEDANHAKMIQPVLDMCSRSVPLDALQQLLKGRP